MIKRKLKAGEWVTVRSQGEILATLDSSGCLDGMPFMPEMLRFCGMTLRVEARAHKTCDTVNNTGGVWVDDALHLEGARCDGKAHGGCQATCLLFWRTAWIEHVAGKAIEADAVSPEVAAALPRDWSCGTPSGTTEADNVYRCQATELPAFVRRMKWWDIRQYIEDLTSRNIGFRKLIRGTWDAFCQAVASSGFGYRLWVALYNRVQRFRGGTPFYWVTGKLSKTPSEVLGLQPGEKVRIKSFDEIMATVDCKNKNRGMGFDTGEMGMHCRRTFEVERRISRIINDRTGKMVVFREPTVTLKGIYCSGERSNVRRFCPRAIPPYWREIWLERVADSRREEQ